MLNRTTNPNIKSLSEDEIFVFGSNSEGNHVGGAAKLAHEKFNAESGENSTIELNGLNNVGSAIGNYSKIKGINGSLVCLVSYDKNGIALDWVTGKIGENGLKENVWYEVKNGNFSEIK